MQNHALKEVRFFSHMMYDISALWTECYSLHTCAHKHTQVYRFAVFLQLSDLVEVQHYDFRCLCLSSCCWSKSDMTLLLPFTKKGQADF